jgi:hypothetical protein
MTLDPMDDYEPVVPEHHGKPMRRIHSRYGWEGKPGDGFSVETHYYGCRECEAGADVTYRIPG